MRKILSLIIISGILLSFGACNKENDNQFSSNEKVSDIEEFISAIQENEEKPIPLQNAIKHLSNPDNQYGMGYFYDLNFDNVPELIEVHGGENYDDYLVYDISSENYELDSLIGFFCMAGSNISLYKSKDSADAFYLNEYAGIAEKYKLYNGKLVTTVLAESDDYTGYRVNTDSNTLNELEMYDIYAYKNIVNGKDGEIKGFCKFDDVKAKYLHDKDLEKYLSDYELVKEIEFIPIKSSNTSHIEEAYYNCLNDSNDEFDVSEIINMKSSDLIKSNGNYFDKNSYSFDRSYCYSCQQYEYSIINGLKSLRKLTLRNVMGSDNEFFDFNLVYDLTNITDLEIRFDVEFDTSLISKMVNLENIMLLDTFESLDFLKENKNLKTIFVGSSSEDNYYEPLYELPNLEVLAISRHGTLFTEKQIAGLREHFPNLVYSIYN